MLIRLLRIEDSNRNSELDNEQFNQDRADHRSHFDIVRAMLVPRDVWRGNNPRQQRQLDIDAHNRNAIQFF